MLTAVVVAVAQLSVTACMPDTSISCTLSGCAKAVKFCEYPGWGPCECLEPLGQSGFVTGRLLFYQHRATSARQPATALERVTSRLSSTHSFPFARSRLN